MQTDGSTSKSKSPSIPSTVASIMTAAGNVAPALNANAPTHQRTASMRTFSRAPVRLRSARSKARWVVVALDGKSVALSPGPRPRTSIRALLPRNPRVGFRRCCTAAVSGVVGLRSTSAVVDCRQAVRRKYDERECTGRDEPCGGNDEAGGSTNADTRCRSIET